MGLCFQTIITNGPKMQQMDKTTDTGWVWFVGRRTPEPLRNAEGQLRYEWHIQGIASNEEAAIQMCADQDYFIGPLPIDVALSHERVEWPDSYFPLRDN